MLSKLPPQFTKSIVRLVMVAVTASLATTASASAAPVARNPFANTQLSHYLHTRGNVTAALYDPASGKTYLYRPGVREVTASMVKIDILADLLFEAQSDHRTLTPDEQYLATTMIEDSDNASAQRLWNDIGGFGTSSRVTGDGGYYPIQAFNRRIGFTQTVTSWGWGTMDTTPADFVKLLRAIWLPSRVLSPASQGYERTLMERVTPTQRFGVPNGVPANATVGVKNGWYPEPFGWQVNSAGYVHLGAVTYLAVVMTANNPNENYGLDTVNTLGSLLWRFESAQSSRA